MVAAVLINTEAMIAELPKKNAPAAGMPPAAAWLAWTSVSRPCRASIKKRKPRQ
jgi:hypothetical protein